MDIEFYLELDSPQQPAEVREHVRRVSEEQQAVRLNFHDRQERFGTFRGLGRAQSQFREMGLPLPFRIITGFIYFVFVPLLTALAWVVTLPAKLSMSSTGGGRDMSIPRFEVSSDRPLELSEVTGVVSRLVELADAENVCLSMSRPDPEEESYEETASRESISVSDLAASDEDALAALVGKKLDISTGRSEES